MRETTKDLRSYNRTSFKLFAVVAVLTIVFDYFGVSMKEVTEYVGGVVEKTHENVNLLILWGWPILTLIKEQVDDWRKSLHARDIEIEKIRGGQDNRRVSE